MGRAGAGEKNKEGTGTDEAEDVQAAGQSELGAIEHAIESEEGANALASTLDEIKSLKLIDQELAKAQAEEKTKSSKQEINQKIIESKTIQSLKHVSKDE